jgi:hypothetical protein
MTGCTSSSSLVKCPYKTNELSHSLLNYTENHKSKQFCAITKYYNKKLITLAKVVTNIKMKIMILKVDVDTYVIAILFSVLLNSSMPKEL